MNTIKTPEQQNYTVLKFMNEKGNWCGWHIDLNSYRITQINFARCRHTRDVRSEHVVLPPHCFFVLFYTLILSFSGHEK